MNKNKGKANNSTLVLKKSPLVLESREFIQSIFDTLSSRIVVLNDQGIIVAVNQTWKEEGQKGGLTDPSFGIGMNYLDHCASMKDDFVEEGKAIANGIRQVISRALPGVDVEYTIQTGGREKRFITHISSFSFKNRYVVVAHEDVTQWKLTEKKNLLKDNQYREVVQRAAEGIVITNADGRIVEWNQGQSLISGISRENAIGRYLWDVESELYGEEIPSAFSQRSEAEILEVLSTGKSVHRDEIIQTAIKRSDGKIVPLMIVSCPVKMDNKYMLCSFYRDVSQIKQTAAPTRIDLTQYQTYVENNPLCAFVLNKSGNFTNVNKAACNQLGYTANELTGMNVNQLMNTVDASYFIAMENTLKVDHHSAKEIVLMTKKQKPVYCLSTSVKLPDDSLLVFCTDITEIKNFEYELMKNKAFLQETLDYIPMIISVKDANTLRYLNVNQKFEEYTGITRDQIIGNTDQLMFSKPEAEARMEMDRKLVHSHAIMEVKDEKMRRGNSGMSVVNEKKIPVYDENGHPQYILSMAEDISEKIQAEKQSNLRLAMLEAIGELSSTLFIAQTREEMLPMLLDKMLDVVNADMGTLWLYNLEKNELQQAYVRGEEQELGYLVDVPIKPGEGIVGRVFDSRQAYIVKDYMTDPNLAPVMRDLIKPGFGGVKVPLCTTDSVIGVVSISVSHPRVITDAEVSILTTLSEIAGNAIHRITLKEQTDQRLKQLTALSIIDRAISSSFDLQISLELLVSNVISQLKMDAADVLLFNSKSQSLEYSTGQGFRTNIAQSTHLRIGEGHAGRIAYDRKLTQVKNLHDPGNRVFNDLIDHEKFASYIGVPLLAKGQLKGVLEVFHRTKFEPDDDWISFIRALADQASIAIDNTQMFDNLQRSNTELNFAYNATIEGWSRALDLRDKETEGHTQRVTEATIKVARDFGYTDNELKNIRWGSMLHDIGKLGVPDEILLKPAPLTPSDWDVMRMHPSYAYEMLWPINYLRGSLDIPYCHHEKWDGTGYPRKLAGNQIPLTARIFAVVDIWDALRSDRPYRKAWSGEKVKEYINSLAGTHLDPQVVKVCLESDVFSTDTIQYS